MTVVAAPQIGRPPRAPSGRLRLNPIMWLALAGAVMIFAVGASVIGNALKATLSDHACTSPTSCVSPPVAPPLGPIQPFTSALGFGFDERSDCSRLSSWHVDEQTAYGIKWIVGGVWSVEVRGTPFIAQSLDQIADRFAGTLPNGASLVYRIPGAELGGVPGIGRVYSDTLMSSDGQSRPMRAFVIVAARHGVAVRLTGVGPYTENNTKNFGHSNPAATALAECVVGMVNTMHWAGDPEP